MNKPILFSLENCKRCEYVKKHLPEGVDIEIKTYPHDLKEWSPDQLAEAAYYEVLSDLQRTAPILLLPDGKKLTSVIDIKNFLSNIKQ
ncbi:MAG TPA: hypothetical protein ENL44_01905 [Thermoplasmatales archaeon]|nr:MAG: hypothetical protein FE042_06840 [Thermoplasmata archaeon]KAA0015651.1 MAG: hypothetical protein FE037_01935 [Thermoplasmata archaeon]MCD6542680.1 hypothetical protein [Thermoplasmata archaeon]HHF58937.1 hypothetical protein [Thermoplasmatales archaeon]